MKHILRKPLLPVLLLIVLCFSVCFMTLFQKSIEDDTALVDQLYRNTRLEFQILPGDSGGSVLHLDTYTGGKIINVEEIAETCTFMWCGYSVREPASHVGIGKAYGTNNISMLAQEKGLRIDYEEGFHPDSFFTISEQGIPCVMDAVLVETLELQLGSTFVIAPTEDQSMDPEKAPSLTMLLVGSYTQEEAELDPNGIIVPEDIFLAKPGLLYNSNMMYDCFYRGFYFRIDPQYNREYEQVEQIVEETLDDPDEYRIHSNAKSLEQMVRPIERKLAIQQILVAPLAVLLSLAAGILAILMSMSFQTEVFLRFMWGEPRWQVFLKMLGSICLYLLVSTLLTRGLVWILAGKEWLNWSDRYLCALVCICLTAVSIPIIINCTKNLVKLYQFREG